MDAHAGIYSSASWQWCREEQLATYVYFWFGPHIINLLLPLWWLYRLRMVSVPGKASELSVYLATSRFGQC